MNGFMISTQDSPGIAARVLEASAARGVNVFPIYGLANKVEPMVLGLPFSLFWIVAWIAVEFVGLLCFIAYEFSGSR